MKSLFLRIKNRFLRITAILLVSVTALVIAVIIFISPIAKYLIERYSEEYTGRKMEMSWLYVNPFTGRFHAYGFIIHEKKSKSNFISVGDCSFNISLLKLRSNSIDVSSITLDHLWINIVENKSQFNWDGFFNSDSTKAKPASKKAKAWAFSFRDIRLLNSEVVYNETSIPVHYKATKLNVECAAIQSDLAASAFKYDFTFQEKSGNVSGLFKMNFKNNDYDLKTVMKDFDMKTLDQYLREMTTYGYFSAMLNTDIDAKGNFSNAKNLIATGKLALTDFHFGKSASEDYLSFTKLAFDVDTLSPMNSKYLFRSVFLDSAYVKYQLYDSLDNFTRMIGSKGEQVSTAYTDHARENIVFQIAHYIALVAEDLIHSQYRADDFKISNAKALYEDYSLTQKFAVSVSPLNITAEHVDTRAKRTDVTLHTKLNPFGDLDIKLNVNPLDFGDFVLSYNIGHVPVPLFNPYSVYYTSYPFDKGTLALNGTWVVKDKQIGSSNHLQVANATLATKVKKDDTKKFPIRVALFFVRDVDREIDLTIPITGNLNNPKYHLRSAIIQVIRNLFVKPPSFPVLKVKSVLAIENKNYDLVEWPLMSSKMNFIHEAQLRKISRYLFFHPKERITVIPCYFESREKEALLFFEAKKRFFCLQNHKPESLFSGKDSAETNRLSIKNRAFVHYLNLQNNASSEFTTQGKCLLLIGQAKVNEDYLRLNNERKRYLESYFKEHNEPEHLTFGKTVSEIPASGFSHYRLYYSIPEEDKK